MSEKDTDKGAIMDTTYSLEELLNLALGTPEIGAVNFNYLYEVIFEVLKHLGILKKFAGTTDIVDYQIQLLSGRSTPIPDEGSLHFQGDEGNFNAGSHHTERLKTVTNAEDKSRELSPQVSEGVAAKNGQVKKEKVDGKSGGLKSSQEKSRAALEKNPREDASNIYGSSKDGTHKSSATGKESGEDSSKRRGAEGSGSGKNASQKAETPKMSSKKGDSKLVSSNNAKTSDGKPSSTKGEETEASSKKEKSKPIAPENGKTPHGKSSSTKEGEIEASAKQGGSVSGSPENDKTPDEKSSAAEEREKESSAKKDGQRSISPEHAKTPDGKSPSAKEGEIEAPLKEDGPRSVSPENGKTPDGKASSAKEEEMETSSRKGDSKPMTPKNDKTPDGKQSSARGTANSGPESPEDRASTRGGAHSGPKDPEDRALSRGEALSGPESPEDRASTRGIVHSGPESPEDRALTRARVHSGPESPEGRASTRGGAHSGPESPEDRALTRGKTHSGLESPWDRASTRGGAHSGHGSPGGRASTRGVPNSGRESIGGRASTRGGAHSGPENPMIHAPRRGSNAGVSDKRLSLISGASEGSNPSHQDVLLVNRSLERKDSKTPAGDMWHVLNMNRRLEAAEATIQGMAGLIDGISSDVGELKDSIKNLDDVKVLSAALPNQKDESDEALSILSVEGPLITYAKGKEEIEHFFSASSLETTQDEEHHDEEHHDEEPTSNPLSAKSSEERPEQTPPKRKESRIKILQDVLIRIMKLEEDYKFMKEDLESGKKSVSSKTPTSDLDLMNKQIDRLGKEMLTLQTTFSVIDFMQEDLSRVCIQSDSLKKATDQVSQDQEEINISITKIEKEMKSLTDRFNSRMDSNMSLSDSRSENFAVLRLKTLVSDIQEQQRLLEGEVNRIDKEKIANTEHLQCVDQTLEELQETKVDKETNEKLLEEKADKIQLEEKVSQNQFDTCIGHFDRNLQDMMQRVDGQETIIRQCLARVETTLDRKASRAELHRLNDTLDHRFKTIKLPPPESEKPDEGAAGFRKPLLRDFHCISCNHAVEIPQGDAIPSLANGEALPGTKVMRPYTTFELEQIRRQIRGAGYKDKFEMGTQREKLQKQLLRLCGASDLDALAARTARQCGGTHTLLDPQKRAMVKTTVMVREDTLQIRADPEPMIEGDVLGRDGQIYRGRQDALPPLPRKEVTASKAQHETPVTARNSLQGSKTEIKTEIKAM